MNDTPKPEFRDHYYTLGVDIDATGVVVEQTYWQRIRASAAGWPETPARPQDIEALNEAYRVLMTPELRSSYDAERAEVLGANAGPTGPAPERPELPLRVMESQMPALRKQADIVEELAADGWSLPVPARLLAGSFTVVATTTFIAIRWLVF